MSAIPDRVPPSTPTPRALYAYAVQQRQCFREIAELLRSIKRKHEQAEGKEAGPDGAE